MVIKSKLAILLALFHQKLLFLEVVVIVLNKKIMGNRIGDDGATKYMAILLFIRAVHINLKRIGDR